MGELQRVVRQGRKILANLWLEKILSTRDVCFFFQAPSIGGDARLELKQTFFKNGMNWRHFRGSVAKHYIRESPYRNLEPLLQGPLMVAYPREAKDMDVSLGWMLGIAKQYNMGLLGAKWRNQFLTAQDVKALKSEAVFRGEVLSLVMTYQRSVLMAIKKHIENKTGGTEGEGGPKDAAAAPAEPEAK